MECGWGEAMKGQDSWREWNFSFSSLEERRRRLEVSFAERRQLQRCVDDDEEALTSPFCMNELSIDKLSL